MTASNARTTGHMVNSANSTVTFCWKINLGPVALFNGKLRDPLLDFPKCSHKRAPKVPLPPLEVLAQEQEHPHACSLTSTQVTPTLRSESGWHSREI